MQRKMKVLIALLKFQNGGDVTHKAQPVPMSCLRENKAAVHNACCTFPSRFV